jgi:hypothetical protein
LCSFEIIQGRCENFQRLRSVFSEGVFTHVGSTNMAVFENVGLMYMPFTAVLMVKWGSKPWISGGILKKNVTNSHYNNCNRINNRQGFKLTLHHRLINHRSITIITRKNSKIYWFITLFYPSWTLIARSEFIQQQ